MGSFAEDLKTEREKRNISLAHIAADTRISLHYLESLEEGRYRDLPGGMYNRAFIRAYCESLNLDPQEIVQRYEVEVSTPQDKVPKTKVHIPQKDASFRPNPVLIWGLMLLISAVGIFFSRQWIAEIFSPYFSRKPAVTLPVERAQKQAMPPATSGQQTSSVPQVTVPLAPPDAAKLFAPSTPMPEPPSSIPPLDSIRQAGDNSNPSPSLPLALHLEIKITEKCWVSINKDGNPALRRLMDAGESQSFQAAEQFFIVVGNAGGIHLRLNGKPVKSLGKAGEVVKVLINDKNLQDFFDQTAG